MHKTNLAGRLLSGDFDHGEPDGLWSDAACGAACIWASERCRCGGGGVARGGREWGAISTPATLGPHVTNQIIKRALHPYKDDFTIVTKVGARRGNDGSWIMDVSAEWLRQSVEDNLRNLGLDALSIVNLRVGA